MDKVISNIIDEVCKETGKDRETVELIYNDMFRFIKKTIEEKDFSGVETDDDLRKVKANFNIPRVFKLYTTLNRIYYARKSITKKNSQHDEGVNVGDGNEKEGRERIGADTPR